MLTEPQDQVPASDPPRASRKPWRQPQVTALSIEETATGTANGGTDGNSLGNYTTAS